MSTTYFITGGGGFIGSNFIEYLLEKEPSVRLINIDKLTYAGNLENLSFLSGNSKYIFIQEDICNATVVEDLFSKYKPDYVVNFAAETHVDRSIKNSEVFIRTNVLGTQVLLQSAMSYKVKKFVQISTDEVYGSLGEEGYFSEKSPLMPNNPYAASKASADLLARSYQITYGLPVIITRSSNNYGPKQHHEKLIPMVIKSCLEGKKIPLYGDGKNIRDWIHVKDHCCAIYTILKKGIPGEVYNVGASNELENIKVVTEIIGQLSILRENLQLDTNISLDLIQYCDDRKGHDFRYGVHAEKIKLELGWKPLITFDVGMKDTIGWYLKRWLNRRGNR